VLSEHQSALTSQGLQLLGTEGECWADHKNRNLFFVTQSAGFEHYNPNFFKTYNDWDHPDQPEHVGYGYDSIMQGINDIRDIIAATAGMAPEQALAKRREMIAALEPLRPLPAQALIGTAINEAVRLSIANGNRYVGFGEDCAPHVL
jgi:hypothetical protein